MNNFFDMLKNKKKQVDNKPEEEHNKSNEKDIKEEENNIPKEKNKLNLFSGMKLKPKTEATTNNESINNSNIVDTSSLSVKKKPAFGFIKNKPKVVSNEEVIDNNIINNDNLNNTKSNKDNYDILDIEISSNIIINNTDNDKDNNDIAPEENNIINNSNNQTISLIENELSKTEKNNNIKILKEYKNIIDQLNDKLKYKNIKSESITILENINKQLICDINYNIEKIKELFEIENNINLLSKNKQNIESEIEELMVKEDYELADTKQKELEKLTNEYNNIQNLKFNILKLIQNNDNNIIENYKSNINVINNNISNNNFPQLINNITEEKDIYFDKQTKNFDHKLKILNNEKDSILLNKTHLETRLSNNKEQKLLLKKNINEENKNIEEELKNLKLKKTEVTEEINKLKLLLKQKEFELEEIDTNIDEKEIQIEDVNKKFESQINKNKITKEEVKKSLQSVESDIEVINKKLSDNNDKKILFQKDIEELDNIIRSLNDINNISNHKEKLAFDNYLQLSKDYLDSKESQFLFIKENCDIIDKYNLKNGELKAISEFIKKSNDIIANNKLEIPKLESSKIEFAKSRQFKEAASVNNQIKILKEQIEKEEFNIIEYENKLKEINSELPEILNKYNLKKKELESKLILSNKNCNNLLTAISDIKDTILEEINSNIFFTETNNYNNINEQLINLENNIKDLKILLTNEAEIVENDDNTIIENKVSEENEEDNKVKIEQLELEIKEIEASIEKCVETEDFEKAEELDKLLIEKQNLLSKYTSN